MEAPLTNDMLEAASLAGIPCRALARLEVTRFEGAFGRRGQRLAVDGVRTWRGRAVIEDASFLQRWQHDAAVRYEGKLHAAGEVQTISADVFVYSTRRTRARTPGAPSLLYVEFVGAGSPFAPSWQV